MKERLEAFESYRQQICKKANIYLIIGVILCILGVALMTMLDYFIILLIIGFVLICINSSMKSKLSKQFKNEFIISYVKEIYPDSVYNPRSGIPVDRILEPGFLKRPDRWHSEDYLKASYDGVGFEMSDFTFEERHVTTDGKGNTRTTYVTYAKGRFMIFDFKREFNQVLKVVETAYLGLNTHGLEKVETESVDFNKKFKTYSSNPLTAFYVLTPQVQLKLLELESKFKGSIFFAYMKGKLYVTITDGISILDIDASKKISENTMATLDSQLMLPAAIINELGLSSDKFSRGDAI